MTFTRFLTSFCRDKRGSIAINFALVAPVLLIAVGSAVDYSIASAQKSTLQNAADAGALAGTKELALGGSNQTHSIHAAKIVAKNNLGKGVKGKATVTASVTADKAGIEVNITVPSEGVFSNLFSSSGSDVQVKAIAKSSSATQKV
jgi:Flp pilus assembly protein TadG